MKETLLVQEKDMPMLARRVLSVLESSGSSRAKVLLLEGDLGAGKTTFTKALAEVLGIEKEDVHSPTFILKKEYPASHETFTKLVHIDAYRFTHPSEAKVLRLEEDLQDPGTIVAIEWPSKMKYLASDIVLSFDVVDDETRQVELSSLDIKTLRP
jgi:tRNA threonylcarbamoyladenosine biosynthesis protein TsaE